MLCSSDKAKKSSESTDIQGAFGKFHDILKTTAVARAKARKLRIGGQGSFSKICKDLRAANPSLKGDALSQLVNDIFGGKKDLQAEISRLQRAKE
jgi:hypothetical protein